MLGKIYNRLHDVVLSIDVEFFHQIRDWQIADKSLELNKILSDYNSNPEILHKEIHEVWCKTDVDRFVFLMDTLLKKPDDWVFLADVRVPMFGDMVNQLCIMYDEIAQRLNLINNNPEDARNVLQLPPELDTDRARKYFARAIELGYMEQTATGYKWLLMDGKRGRKARLAYFLEKVYCPEYTNTINAEQYRQLERLFGVTRLDRAVQTNADTGKTQAVLKWRAEIDKNVFD